MRGGYGSVAGFGRLNVPPSFQREERPHIVRSGTSLMPLPRQIGKGPRPMLSGPQGNSDLCVQRTGRVFILILNVRQFDLQGTNESLLVQTDC